LSEHWTIAEVSTQMNTRIRRSRSTGVLGANDRKLRQPAKVAGYRRDHKQMNCAAHSYGRRERSPVNEVAKR
jgi:hypothetical protein